MVMHILCVNGVNYWRNNKYTSKIAVVDFPRSGDPMLPILALPLYGDTRHEPFLLFLCVGAMVVNCGTDVRYGIWLFAITVMYRYSSIELVRLENR